MPFIPPFLLDGLSFSRGVNHLAFILTAAFLGCRSLSFGCWLLPGAGRVDRVDTTKPGFAHARAGVLAGVFRRILENDILSREPLPILLFLYAFG
jgi:hypothetical protein